MIWLYIIIAIILFLLIGHFVAIFFIFLQFFHRISLKRIDKSTKSTPYTRPYVEEMYKIREELLNSSYEEVTITSFDQKKLKAYYFNNNSNKTMILCHGFHTHAFNNFGYATKYFLAHNYNVLVINQRAHQSSEGSFSTYGQKESKDILSWINYVDKDEKISGIYLYGISMGAASVAFASEYIVSKKVKFLIMEGIFSSVDSLVNHIVKSQKVPAFLFRGGVVFYSKIFAGIKWNDKTTVDALKNNHIPSIFVHGTKDIVAIKDFFEDNYNNCFSNKYKIIVEGAPHALCALHEKDAFLDKINNIIGDHHE